MAVLTVLLGAGASYDCANTEVSTFSNWRPPLVNELFRPSFAGILKQYPKAEAAADEIRTALRRPNANSPTTLEGLLRSAMEDENEYVRKCFREIPLYIQHVIGEVGENYVPVGATLFASLVSQIARTIPRKFKRVLYLTTNYDLLLDRQLATLYDHPFGSLNHYTSHRLWALVKLHGSVNWGRPLFETTASPSEIAPNLPLLAKLEKEPHQILSEPVHLSGHTERMRDGHFMYPVISVPIEGKSAFVCPDSHAEVARSLISDSEHFLIVGCRIADQDVLDLFGLVKNAESLNVVAHNQESAEEVVTRLAARNRAFQKFVRDPRATPQGGFLNFMLDGSINGFLNS